MELKKLGELKRLYKLHSLRDVYVEGNSDLKYFRAVARHLGVKNVIFYCVDSVEIEPNLVSGLGLSPKMNRDKVVALMMLLNLKSDFPVGIIDQDFSHWRPDKHKNNNVVTTDQANTDMYVLNGDNLEKLFDFLKVPISVNSTLNVLNQMFTLRFVCSASNVGLKVLSTWTKHVSINGQNLSVDIEKIIRLSNSRKKSLMDTVDIIKLHSRTIAEFPEMRTMGYFNGHDAYDITAILVSKFRKGCKVGHDEMRDFLQLADHSGGTLSKEFLNRVYGV